MFKTFVPLFSGHASNCSLARKTLMFETSVRPVGTEASPAGKHAFRNKFKTHSDINICLFYYYLYCYYYNVGY